MLGLGIAFEEGYGETEKDLEVNNKMIKGLWVLWEKLEGIRDVWFEETRVGYDAMRLNSSTKTDLD